MKGKEETRWLVEGGGGWTAPTFQILSFRDLPRLDQPYFNKS